MTIPLRTIIEEASRIWTIPVSDIMGPRRVRLFTAPRFAIWRVAHDFGRSYTDIGRRMEGRDHTSIRYGSLQVNEKDPRYVALRKFVEQWHRDNYQEPMSDHTAWKIREFAS